MTDNMPVSFPAGGGSSPAPGQEAPYFWETPAETAAHGAMMGRPKPYLLCSAVCGFSFALLYCDARAGINVPVFSAIWLVCIVICLKSMGLYTRRRVLPPAAGMLLLGLSTAMTANYDVQLINRAGIVVLMAMVLLRSFCQTGRWQFGKYFTAVLGLAFTALSRLPDPVRCLRGIRSADGGTQSGKGRYVLLGLALSLPLASVVVALLGSADAVFAMLVSRALNFDLDLSGGVLTSFKALWLFLLGFFGLFCSLAGQAQSPVDSAVRETKKREPVTAITFVSVLAAIYLLFCSVQIIYLFIGRDGGLPEGFTYAGYARRGFFQLLFVSMLNAAGVVFCSWKFRDSRVLRALLTLVCACTYVLIASSAYRMLMYVDVYGLTFLRILVLWFLGVLAILMAGIVVSLYRRGWNLFRFTFCVCLSLWLAFSFAKPDRIAARYNLERFGVTDDTVRLTLYELSLDAVPVMAGRDYCGTFAGEWNGYLRFHVPRRMDEHGARGFNFAVWEAARSADRTE